MEESSKGTVIVASLTNLAILVVKVIAAVITGSASLFSESAHSAVDFANQGFLFVGLRRSKRARDFEHPFGYGPERYLSSYTVAVTLFFLGSLLSIREGVVKLSSSSKVDSPVVAIAVLALSFALEANSYRKASKESKRERIDGESLLKFAKRTKNSEVFLIMFEDLGALVGIVIALVALTLSIVTKNEVFDAIGSIVIGIVLAIISFFIYRESKSLLLGEGVGDEDLATIEAAVVEAGLPKRIIYIRSMHLSPDDVLLTLKVAYSPSVSMAEVAEDIDQAEARIRSSLPIVGQIFFEPDVYHENG
ncbi:MAG: cation diffusion facilitator family transporter [Actinomycetota bacterium]|nr:cation diffusion facilitator family transporter [Actinomycetota bacterium]